ncbi:hypothetical protein EHS25_008962 [Saitozyma podzolica]|uniref:Uncharacterized protein n=1 Tax=Saitozyma podzolica TaxID=1890683 RepID=A0A427YKG9_9TREE|nr:hypothetical protein EHS25_008962 [Saitozyma podzolica]
MTTLSIRDNSVLATLFDAGASGSAVTPLQHFTESPPGLQEDDFIRCSRHELSALLPLDQPNPSSQALTDSIAALSNIIQEQPRYASAYVNRAQARRLLMAYDKLFSSQEAKCTNQVLSDLNLAVELASPPSPRSPVTPHQSTLLAAAHTHRGLLLLRAADLIRRGSEVYGLPDHLLKLGSDALEEAASRDFEAGGRYGDKMAKDMAVRTNPYAKMCGSIVQEAQRRELEAYHGWSGVQS